MIRRHGVKKEKSKARESVYGCQVLVEETADYCLLLSNNKTIAPNSLACRTNVKQEQS